MGLKGINLTMRHPHQIPSVVWQGLLMGLLGLAGVVFIPVLLRVVDAALVGRMLVAQVFVYYLALLTQYGFAWTGPAALARAASSASAASRVWQRSISTKLWLLCVPVGLALAVAYSLWAGAGPELWVFVLLLAAYALNSNWFLQAHGDFHTGVLYAGMGVVLSVCLLGILATGLFATEGFLTGSIVAAILVLPQVLLGVGSWLRVRTTTTAYRADCTISLGESSVREILKKDGPVALAQLLLLASTTLGTLVVGALADADTTTAYAATEKLFNLAATFFVGVYGAIYPVLARLYYEDRSAYWAKVSKVLGISFGLCLALSIVLIWMGPQLLAIYLSARLAEHITSVLLPFTVWLALCLSQHLLTSHMVFAERRLRVVWVNGLVLVVTGAVGAALSHIEPVYWVYGMIAGQLLSLVWLLQCYREDCDCDETIV